jgi:hypothetical protein
MINNNVKKWAMCVAILLATTLVVSAANFVAPEAKAQQQGQSGGTSGNSGGGAGQQDRNQTKNPGPFDSPKCNIKLPTKPDPTAIFVWSRPA